MPIHCTLLWSTGSAVSWAVAVEPLPDGDVGLELPLQAMTPAASRSADN